MTRLNPQDLLARAEIADVLHAYSRGIDRRDIELLTDLFTENGSFDYGHGNVTTGRANLRELFITATGRYDATNHHCSTIAYLRLDDHSASTITYVYAYHDNVEQNLNLHVWGCYEDEFVNETDRWRISIRRVRVAGAASTSSQPLPERFARYERAIM